VLPDGENSEPRLIITKGLKAEYVTLSHRWGSSQPLKTTKTTLQENLKQIPFAILPKTFQHAVEVTRELGYRYLWIDSLCIVQKDDLEQTETEDWEIECSKMSDTYQNSSLTIAGVMAEDSNSGFLRQSRMGKSTQVTLNWAIPAKSVQGNFSFTRLDPDYALEAPLPIYQNPLATRGWIAQERLLSHRMLNFTNSSMYMECLTNVHVNDSHFPFNFNFNPNGSISSYLEKRSFQNLGSPEECYQYWYRIVDDYSTKGFTYQKDKLPALSGIARLIQQQLGDRYIAGLWEKDLVRGLSWQVNERFCLKCVHNGFSAPSWSWASIDQAITLTAFPPPLKFFANLEILNVQLEKCSNPYGLVSRGELIVRGKFKFGFSGGQGEHVMDNDELSKIGRYIPDTKDSSTDVFFLELGSYPDGIQRSIVAIGVRPVIGPSNDLYQRVGLLSGNWEEMDSTENNGLTLSQFFADADTETIRLI
jgi:hypothetical protein